jgi:hypothetical protein
MSSFVFTERVRLSGALHPTISQLLGAFSGYRVGVPIGLYADKTGDNAVKTR